MWYNSFNLMILGFLFYFCTACDITRETPLTPNSETTPVQIVEKNTITLDPVVQKAKTTHKLGIIGEVEPVYFLPMKRPFWARIDTGAKGSAINAQNIHFFEREGEKWVGFDLINDKVGEKHHFEKKIYGQVSIKRQGIDENRVAVLMTVRLGKEKITAQFSLADRSKFDYQVLIGRNILTGRAIVDTSLSKTLY